MRKRESYLEKLKKVAQKHKIPSINLDKVGKNKFDEAIHEFLKQTASHCVIKAQKKLDKQKNGRYTTVEHEKDAQNRDYLF
jgi:hypothetical protein